MRHFTAFHPDHMMYGQNILAHERAIGSDRIHPLLEKHGLAQIDPQAWYPVQKWLDVLSDMADEGGAMFDFVSVGMKMVDNAIFPPELEKLPLLEVLKMVDKVYPMNNKGTDVGYVRCEVVNDKHVKMYVRVPAPDDEWYGIIYGYVRRFAPKGAHFTVHYDRDIPRRDQGGDVTIIHVLLD